MDKEGNLHREDTILNYAVLGVLSFRTTPGVSFWDGSPSHVIETKVKQVMVY